MHDSKVTASMRARRWRDKNREKDLARKRAHYAANKKKYRLYKLRSQSEVEIIEQEYDQRLAAQNNRCAICNVEFIETPHLDHDHKTKAVRGFLCQQHNQGLGLFQDDPALLRKAADYLETSRA